MKTIFVSSTFNDMQYERDAIQEIAMPRINANARKYGESVSFCDLRWGVNTTTLESDEGSKKVLDVCLNEIDRCRPYMVVILGDRYGWIPSLQLIGSVAASKNLDLDDLEMSVTALEIEYGALSDAGNLDHTLFYFREFESEVPSEYSSEDEAHKKKLNELKARIDKLSGGKTKHYSVSWDGDKLHGIDRFASMLASDISSLLESEWIRRSTLPDFEKDRLLHDEFVEDNQKLFCIREALLDELLADVEQKKKLIRIDGACGSGKSVLLARLARSIDQRYDVLFYACGISAMSAAPSDISRGIVSFLENVLEKPHYDIDAEEDEEKIILYTKELYREYDLSGRHLVLIIDGLEKLVATEARDKLRFLPYPRLLNHCSFVISSAGLAISVVGNLAEEYFSILDEWNATKVIGLDDEINENEKKKVLGNILRANSKELDQTVIDYIVTSKKIKSLYEMNLIVSGLLSMNKEDFVQIKRYGNGMDAINRYQKELIDTFPEDEEKLSCLLLKKYAESMGLEFVNEVTKFIAVSRFGLLETDLKYLVERYNTLDFVHFTTYFNEFFIQRHDGRYDFSHQCIRNGIVKSIADRVAYSKRIIQALSRRDDDVKLQEITHQLIIADDKTGFIEFVKEWHEYGYFLHNEVLQRAADRALYFAARALYEHCESNGEKWIVDLINEAEGVNQAFLHFLNSRFCRYLDENRDDKMVDMKIKIYTAIFMNTGEPLEKESNEESDRRHNVVKSLDVLAQATLERGTRKDIEIGLKYFKSYINLVEHLTKMNDPAYQFVDLPSIYSHVTLFVEKIDDIEAAEFALEVLEKKFRVESSEEYEKEKVESPNLGWYTRLAVKLGTKKAIQDAISLQLWEIEHRQKDLCKYGYGSQAYRYVNLIDLYRKLDSYDVEQRVIECCEKIASLMDTYITLDADPGALIGTYFKGYMDAIKELFEHKTASTLKLALDYCKRITYKIMPQREILGNVNGVIMEISQISGEIYSALGEHENAISCFEIVAQIREINLSKEKDAMYWLAECYRSLAKECMQLQGEEHLKKAVEYFEKVLMYRSLFFEQKPTYKHFELVIFARHDLTDAKLASGVYSPSDALQYKYETVKMMEDKLSSDDAMQKLIDNIRMEWQFIVSFCSLHSDVISAGSYIEAQKKHASVLIRMIDKAEKDNNWELRISHLKSLKKCYLKLSGTFMEHGDFNESMKYSALANQIDITG